MYEKYEQMLIRNLSLTTVLTLAIIGLSFSQEANSHDVERKREETSAFKPRISIHNLPKGYYTKMLDEKVEEYQNRMRANVKKYIKMAKEMEKPKYSDPMYFGHKRKPKKRPLKKRRLCTECGIVH